MAELTTKHAEFIEHKAIDSVKLKNFDEALASFCILFKLCPSKKEEYKSDFIYCVQEWCTILMDKNCPSQIIDCFPQILELYPYCKEILGLLGGLLHKLEQYEFALSVLTRALHIDETDPVNTELSDNTKSRLVERWHFKMLNDRVRNQAYFKAIRRMSKEISTILDIGTGSGLLSMIASICNFKKIYACEVCPTICKVARKTFELNDSKMKQSVVLYEKCSNEILIPSDIEERVPLVVTETFDAGLLGERALSTIADAWKRLLTDSGQVIPKKASVYGCLVQSGELRRNFSLAFPALRNLNLSDVRLLYRKLPSVADRKSKPYDCATLNKLEGGFVRLSEEFKILDIDFNNRDEIIKLSENGLEKSMNIRLTSSGKIDAVVTWFDLEVCKNHHIVTSPSSNGSWQQAVYFVLPEDLGRIDSYYSKEEQVQVTISIQDDLINIKCRGGMPSSFESILCGKKTLAEFNDIEYNRAMCQGVEAVLKNRKSPKVCIYSSGVSPIAFQCLQMGVDYVLGPNWAENEEEIVQKICEKINLDSSKVICGCEDLPEFNVLIVNAVDRNGRLSVNVLDHMDVLISRAVEDVIVIPQALKCLGVFVESRSLVEEGGIQKDVCGFNVSAMNDYQTINHQCISLNRLNHVKLSPVFELFNQCLKDTKGMFERTISVETIESGRVDALVYWFEMQMADEVRFSTIKSNNPFDQSAFIHSIPTFVVKEEEQINVRLVCNNSFMHATYEKAMGAQS
ncbi:DgyrCDS335 [Dimorphilus gyrociliatus]|uniref:DgyrCDS335 n=1 Tax=Dimorphilus gyrociliatus TaxID=2664684 RepID=A0A7I8V477_9ANNE|nr:DgyrCDS335 [Dimorphilus gyrociliatus]